MAEPKEWCIALFSPPEADTPHLPHLTLFGPYPSMNFARDMARQYADAYPNTPVVLVPLQSPEDAMLQLPIEKGFA